MSLWRGLPTAALLMLGCSSEPLAPAEVPAELPTQARSDRAPPRTIQDPPLASARDRRLDDAVIATIYAGQSNAKSVAVDSLPPGMPTDAIPYWPTLLGSKTKSNSFVALGPVLDGTHGAECAYGLAVKAAGRDVAILKVARGGSAIAHWLPGSGYPNNAVLVREIQEFRVALRARFPGRFVSWHFIWDQGETEATAASDAGARSWADHFSRIVASVAAACSCSLATHVVRTDIALAGGTALQIRALRAQQESASRSIVDTDNLPTSDGIHRTGAAQNVVGERIAARVLAVTPGSH